MYSINFWPILVASVITFVIGGLWYSPFLFGKEWMQLSNITQADIDATRARGIWKKYLIQFVATFILFCVMGFIAAATNLLDAVDGAFLAFLLWLGFVATFAVSSMLWEKKPFKLILIQNIGFLVTLVIGGAIIGAWR